MHGHHVMHTNIKFLEISTINYSINMAPIDDALAALKSLKLGEQPNFAQVADKYGCERSTLSKRWRGVQGSMAQKVENQQLLNNTQQAELLRYIEGLTARGLPPTRQMIRNFASEIAGRPAGIRWVNRFIKRHKVDLLSPWASGMDTESKRDDFAFKYSWQALFKEKTVLSAFEKCGLQPFNPERVLARFAQKEEGPSSATDSASSVLSASDWRKIERLLRQVVADTYDKGSRQLSQTIHTMAVRNTLLTQENDRLREALINEKKKRKRGKALLLEDPSQYDGGAIFWSPQKVQEARDRQEQKDAEEKALQHQKEENQLGREAQKAEKARMLEERKRTRAVAKELRLEAQTQKELRKLANKPSQSHKAGSKAKGKSKAITPQISEDEEELQEELSDGDLVLEMAAPTSARSRRNRNINLPKRYRN
jgi:hypothetical protein